MIWLILGALFGLLWSVSDKSEDCDPDNWPDWDVGGEA